jgi:multidrug efflux pump subunit AcrB
MNIAFTGVVVNNAIVLTDYLQSLRKEATDKTEGTILAVLKGLIRIMRLCFSPHPGTGGNDE